MVKYYLLFTFSLFFLMGLSIYFLSEKFALGDNFPATSVYRSDQKGESVIFETLSRDTSKMIITHEDPLKSFAKYDNCFYIFNSLNLSSEAKTEALARKIYGGEHILLTGVEKYAELVLSDETESSDKEKEVSKNGKKESVSKVETPIVKKETYQNKLFDLINNAKWDKDTSLVASDDVFQLKGSSKKVFKEFGPSFHVECQDEGRKPILISATFGKGKVFLLSDDYFLSNEYFLKNKDDAFLEEIFIKSPKDLIVFDQTMIGVWVSPGLMGLVRKYHFEGVILGFLIIGLLLVWRLGAEHQFKSDYIPKSDLKKEDLIPAEDPLMILLKNNINVADLVKHSFHELESSSKLRHEISPSKLMEVKNISQQMSFDGTAEIVAVYNKIVKCIKIGKTK